MNTSVIGAGPAGLTAAYALAKAQRGVDVFEASGSVGGLARSIKLWGQTVDVGPHRFFSRDRRVNELWLEVVGRDYAMVRRLTRILYQDRFFQYPLQPLDALSKLGPVEAARCVASYTGERLRGFQPVSGFKGKSSDSLNACTASNGTFETWVRRRFGRRLFEIFFKTYSEKLWGIPCDELDADFAAQRIKQFSLSAALKSAFFKNGSRHRTLADEFAYPTGGTGMVYEHMAEAVRRNGGQVHLNTPVRRVLTEGGKVVAIEVWRRRTSCGSSGRESAQTSFSASQGSEAGLRNDPTHVGCYDSAGEGEIVSLRCDHVISTMPLTLLVERLPEAPDHVREAARQLTFRNTILVYLEVASAKVCPDQWIYIHSPELRTGRITNFRNWVPQLYGDRPNTILAMEYWCDGEPESGKQIADSRNRLEPPHVGCYNDEKTGMSVDLWRMSDDGLIRLARRELLATTLVKDESLILNGMVYRIPRCYPVYRRGYKDLLRPIQEYLSSIRGLQVIGRYGSFKYNNQDHSILMGILAAENILHNAGHDLWSVNADYDTYQEGWKITETGLAPAGGG